MIKLQKITKTFLIMIFIMFFMFSTRYNVNAAENVYSTSTTSKQGDVIYFEKPTSWGNDTPYIYAWDEYTNQRALNGGWPGSTMTQVEGNPNLYKYEFLDNTPYTHVIFHNNAGTQTENLDFICNGFVYNTETIEKVKDIAFSFKTLKLGDTFYFEKPTSWSDTVYVYMWNSVNNNANADWNQKPAMTHVSGNLYSYTLSSADNNVSNGFDMVIFAGFENDVQKQTKNLSFVGKSLTFKANNYIISSGEDYGKYDGSWMYDQDKTSLSTLIKNTTLPDGKNDKSYYTADSYKIYEEQFKLAQTVVNSKYVAASFSDLTSQYDKSLIALQFAYDNLKIATKNLDDKIEEMQKVDTSKYEQSLVDAFNTSIEQAKQLSKEISANSDNMTQKEKNEAIDNMKNAITNMETACKNLVVDKTELESVINKAKGINTTLYTDESIKNLLDILTKATEVYQDKDASYSDVQEQITKLNDAISKLVLKENEANENTTDNQNTSVNKESSTNSNPYTSDTILVLVGILAIAITICIGTTIYLKKIKNNKN